MYRNYGDVNFFEHGVLVDKDYSDNVFQILRCEPCYDKENLFRFAHLAVDIEDDWIDKDSVMDYIGMTEENFEPIQFAIGCTDLYSWENFRVFDYGFMDSQSILKELNDYLIAYYDLDLDYEVE